MAIEPKTPPIPTIFGERVLTRKPAIKTRSVIINTLSVPLTDEEGSEIENLSDYTVKIKYADGAIIKPIVATQEDEITLDEGNVIFTPPASVRNYPGVYLVSIGLLNEDEELKFTKELWLYNEPSVWQDENATSSALPTEEDIRASIRDSSIAENEILGTLQFGIEELALAAVETVKIWNETPPPVDRYSTRNFPYEYLWKLGIKSILYDIATYWHSKVQLPYNAGGVSVDELNRTQAFAAFAQKLSQEFRQQMLRLKSMANLHRAWAKLGR